MFDWQNGQPYSHRFEDVYFSRNAGLAEKRHVFLEGNLLAHRFASLSTGDGLVIGETGFGTGLAFLCALQLFDQTAPPDSHLDFFSIEKFPLEDKELADALALWPELRQYADELIMRWKRRVPGWNRWSFASGRVHLTLVISDVAAALAEIGCDIDAWFLDGFSPRRNPDMWTQQVFTRIARASRPGATFATYTCAGGVRRGLEQAGFHVIKSPGFGQKRQMLRGCLSGARPARRAPRTAVVIGGGVAGCAAASALAARGVAVTLVERATGLAAGASGNPQGILHARLSAGMNQLHRFVLASYGHALALLDEKLPADGVVRAECGELQLAFSDEEAKRITKLAALNWPEHLLRPVNASEASRLAGIEVPNGGLWFPAGGWIVPLEMCIALTKSATIILRTGCRVESLNPVEDGWLVEGKDQHNQTWVCQPEIAVICTGSDATSLKPSAHLPITPVRGQITLAPPVPASENLKSIVCASGYLAPSSNGFHLIGATHRFNDAETDVRIAEHVENLSRLAEISPELGKAANLASLNTGALIGRASVRASFPGAMPLVGELSPQLYASLGHGTRGLITAGLCGEVIAAAACGQLLPLPLDVLSALAAAKSSAIIK